MKEQTIKSKVSLTSSPGPTRITPVIHSQNSRIHQMVSRAYHIHQTGLFMILFSQDSALSVSNLLDYLSELIKVPA